MLRENRMKRRIKVLKDNGSTGEIQWGLREGLALQGRAKQGRVRADRDALFLFLRIFP